MRGADLLNRVCRRLRASVSPQIGSCSLTPERQRPANIIASLTTPLRQPSSGRHRRCAAAGHLGSAGLRLAAVAPGGRRRASRPFRGRRRLAERESAGPVTIGRCGSAGRRGRSRRARRPGGTRDGSAKTGPRRGRHRRAARRAGPGADRGGTPPSGTLGPPSPGGPPVWARRACGPPVRPSPRGEFRRSGMVLALSTVEVNMQSRQGQGCRAVADRHRPRGGAARRDAPRPTDRNNPPALTGNGSGPQRPGGRGPGRGLPLWNANRGWKPAAHTETGDGPRPRRRPPR